MFWCTEKTEGHSKTAAFQRDFSAPDLCIFHQQIAFDSIASKATCDCQATRKLAVDRSILVRKGKWFLGRTRKKEGQVQFYRHLDSTRGLKGWLGGF